MQSFDLVIIGGGLVGASVIAALSTSRLRIALIDASMPALDDPRLFALNEASCQFLKRIGVWPLIQDDAATIREVHVSNAGHFGVLRFKKEDATLAALGAVLPAFKIETALNAKLADAAHLTIYRPAKLLSLKEEADGVVLGFSMDDAIHMLKTTFLIGADGTHSTVRKLMGTAVQTYHYLQTALVTRTVLQRPHQHIAYERFTQKNTIAMLPLLGNECATIWTADDATISHLAGLSDDLFLQSLQDTFGERLGTLQAVKKRFTYPLRMVKATTPVTKRIYLLGNAAHTLHPVAAQGFNLALYEVAVLVEGISDWLATGKVWQDLQWLPFHEQCLQQQKSTMRLAHTFSRMVPTHSMFLGSMMGFLLLTLDLLSPIKKRLLARMLGRIGKVPKLLLDANEYE